MRSRSCFNCKHWKTHFWTDDKGIIRWAKCANPNRLISVEEQETRDNPVCWEGET